MKAAACMRANGVPNYPDPKLIDGSIYRNLNASPNINPSSPAFQRAAQKCAHGQPELVGWADRHRQAMTSTASFPIAAALLVGTLLAGCGRSSGGGRDTPGGSPRVGTQARTELQHAAGRRLPESAAIKPSCRPRRPAHASRSCAACARMA